MEPLAGTFLLAGLVDRDRHGNNDHDCNQFEHSLLLLFLCEVVGQRSYPGHFLQASLYGHPGQFIIEGAG